METLAPIVLFVYSRPEHTERTLKALQNNVLVKDSKIYIFADGIRDNANSIEKENVRKVRNIIKREKWCGEIEIIEYEENKGLAESIKAGVSQIVNKYGKVIVMEDDLITSPAFLIYMNKALDYYENRKSVFSISAYNYPESKCKIPKDYQYDVFVSLRNGSWGWATWKDRWGQVDWAASCYKTMTDQMKSGLNRGGDDVYDLLQMWHDGKLNIWSIQFTMAHFINHAVSIVPCKSYVDNIGLDSTGENCRTHTGLRNNELNFKEDIKFLDVLYEDSRIINAFYNANCRKKRPCWQKFVNKIYRFLGKEAPFKIKKKIYH